ncbi:oxidoreductase [Gemmatimonadetes bacterium T265]|nr:oxidoreductase [Gemmatimonadetes bacterium T265]
MPNGQETMMANNRAVRLHGYGGPDTVTVDDVPAPRAGPGEVTVRVAVAGMNPFDRKLRSGALRDELPLTFPVTLGAELAGTVEALGDGVGGLTVGQRVVGWTGNLGAYARLVALGAAALVPVPDGLGDAEAAAVPVAGLTASQALFEHGGLVAGRTVLIHGGSGAVGSFAVQLAARAGATVIATASAPNLAYVRELGAARAVDYADAAALAQVSAVDLVLDLAGRGLDQLWPTLKPGGTLISTAAFDVAARAPASLTARAIQMHADAGQLAALVRRVADGELRATVGRTVAFDDAAAVIEGLGAGPPGKTVLAVR